jgi:hypothetical protein
VNVDMEHVDSDRASKRSANIKIENIKSDEKDYDDLNENEKTDLLKNFAINLRNTIEEKFPYESSFILNDLHDRNIIPQIVLTKSAYSECNELLKNNLEIIVAFKEAQTYKLKRLILSLIADKYSKATLMQMFNISEKIVRSAINHKKKHGAGMFGSTDPIFRDKLDSVRVEIFLDFLCSDNYLQDVASGTRNLKINNNFSINMPNVVRLASHSQIIHDYHEMCKKNNIIPISKSVCYKILKHCSVSYSKSLAGLDNMYADGLDSFDKLEEIINLMKIKNPLNKQLDNLLISLKSSKNYLKFDFKSNMSFSSECSDHCACFALSNKNICEHDHSRKCQECNILDFFIDSLKKNILIEEPTENETMYSYEKSIKKIYEWKNHLIRNWTQDNIKYKILNELDNDSVYLHIDWAMKFLPTKFREKQADWYGKKGISWHVAVAIFLKNNSLTTLTFIHTFESTSQDADAVIGIVDSVLEQIKTQLGPRKIYFRSDNAGCYHNKSLVTILNFLAKKHEHTLKRIDFCEPQTGKDIPDRKIAQSKRAINSNIEKGMNVENAYDLKNAISSSNSIDGLQVFVCKLNNFVDFKNDFKFKNITSYYSFEYYENHLIAFNHYNIGDGVKMKYTDLLNKISLKQLTEKIEKASLVILDSKLNYSDAFLNSKNSNLSLFKCQFENCPFLSSDKNTFKEHQGLHENNLSQISKIKILYAKKAGDINTNNINIVNTFKTNNEESIFNSTEDLKNGFALKKIIRGRYNDNQKEYLIEKFNLGEKNKADKAEPKEVEQDMIRQTKRFTNKERLSTQQIKSFFYNLIQKKRKKIIKTMKRWRMKMMKKLKKMKKTM